MFSATARAYAKCPDHLETLDAEEKVAMCDDYSEEEVEQQYLCEFDCGYKGGFDAVSAHELACDARPAA